MTKNQEGLAEYLQGVTILDGKGSIDLGDSGPVYVSVVHDGSSFHPGAVIVVDQNYFRDLSNDTLQEAFEIMQDRVERGSPDYVKEVQEEWGDQWQEILTETFDGKSWTFKSPKDAAEVIAADKWASKSVEITDSSKE
jgi:hypothetical protein